MNYNFRYQPLVNINLVLCFTKMLFQLCIYTTGTFEIKCKLLPFIQRSTPILFYLVLLDRMNCAHQNKTKSNFPFLSYCQVVYMYIANNNTQISYKNFIQRISFKNNQKKNLRRLKLRKCRPKQHMYMIESNTVNQSNKIHSINHQIFSKQHN